MGPYTDMSNKFNIKSLGIATDVINDKISEHNRFHVVCSTHTVYIFADIKKKIEVECHAIPSHLEKKMDQNVKMHIL